MKKHVLSFLIGAALILALSFCPLLPDSAYPVRSVTAEAAKKKVLNYSNKRLLKGESFKLEVDTDKKVTYKSNNPSIASVSKSGLVRAKKAGKTTIIMKTGQKKYSCKITVSDTVDLILFSGQSNMTGRGDASLAPALTDGAGYECKAVTKPSSIEPIKEPFGMGQDRGTMADGSLRTGSLVTAFTNAYYKQTKTPVVAVSATVAGSGRVSWSTLHYKEAAKRLNAAQKALKKKKIKIRHIYIVHMQGENDGFAGSSVKDYTESLKLYYKNMKKNTDVEACMIIRIGKYVKDRSLYDKVIKAQTNLCKTDENFVLISTKAATLPDSNYAEDGIHIKQSGLNTIGKEAGKHAGIYANTGVEPSIKDAKYKNTYKPDPPAPQ